MQHPLLPQPPGRHESGAPSAFQEWGGIPTLRLRRGPAAHQRARPADPYALLSASRVGWAVGWNPRTRRPLLQVRRSRAPAPSGRWVVSAAAQQLALDDDGHRNRRWGGVLALVAVLVMRPPRRGRGRCAWRDRGRRRRAGAAATDRAANTAQGPRSHARDPRDHPDAQALLPRLDRRIVRLACPTASR